MKLRLLTTLLVLTSLQLATAEEGWIEDFSAAKEQAAKEKKDILLDFTGSDWCSWCIKLRDEVFSKPEFKEAIPKSFVLVEVDFPHEKPQEEKIKLQNTKLQETYSIEGYPSILLTDATGRAFARTGYTPGGPVPYVKDLEAMRASREKRDAAFAKAEKAEGMERAKALDEGLQCLDDEIVTAYYSREIESIISLDKDDTLGRKRGLAINTASKELELKLQTLMAERKTEEFATTIDSFITEWKLEGVSKQRMLMNKLSLYGPDKLDEVDKFLDEVIAINPTSPPAKSAEQVKTQVANMRKKAPEPTEEVKRPKE
jgi:thioredoxin-related protein